MGVVAEIVTVVSFLFILAAIDIRKYQGYDKSFGVIKLDRFYEFLKMN